VNNMHDSLTPIAGLVPLLNMMTDIVIFGGVGAGRARLSLRSWPRRLLYP
jgi:K+-transporting ATPase A subunit